MLALPSPRTWAAPDGGAAQTTALDEESPTDGGARADGGAAPAPLPEASPAPALSPADQQALEKALQGDAAARAAAGTPSPAIAPPLPGTQSPTIPPPMPGNVSLWRRAFQSLNPDISAIIDFAGGLYDGELIKSGDDPRHTGANLQEVELAFSATVDPYFRGDVFITIPNAEGVEVEEAYLTTTSLPGSLQLRGGVMRASFGRQNTQHLHLQDFTRRPQLNAQLLGLDGLRAPGMELSWLAPLPFYLLVTGGFYSVPGVEEIGATLQSFGGGERKDLTYLGNVRFFTPLSDEVSLLLGGSFATGQTSRLIVDMNSGETMADLPQRSYLYGADVYLKWQPPNVSQTWLMLAWTTEFILRHVPGADENAVLGHGSKLEGALYSALILRVARRWVIGVRGEIDGLPAGVDVPRQYAGSGSLTWNLSEFSRVRLYGEGRYTPTADPALQITQGWSSAAFLQLEASIGAHGAHPY